MTSEELADHIALKIKEVTRAIRDFYELQEKHRDSGARDTEPCVVFERIVRRALRGEVDLTRVPNTATGWELYSSVENSPFAALELHAAALRVALTIATAPIAAIPALKRQFGD